MTGYILDIVTHDYKMVDASFTVFNCACTLMVFVYYYQNIRHALEVMFAYLMWVCRCIYNACRFSDAVEWIAYTSGLLAMISHSENGVCYLYNDVVHRTYGPAIQLPSLICWVQYGRLHRVGGPAVTSSTGVELYYVNGELVSESGTTLAGCESKFGDGGTMCGVSLDAELEIIVRRHSTHLTKQVIASEIMKHGPMYRNHAKYREDRSD